MTHLEVQPDGRIFVIDGMPEEPKQKVSDNNDFAWRNKWGPTIEREWEEYQKALASAPRIPVANHNDAFLRIQDQYMPKGAKEFKLKPGIYQVPVEWEVKEKFGVDDTCQSWDDHACSCPYPCGRKVVAILKESPKEESQDKLWANVISDVWANNDANKLITHFKTYYVLTRKK